MTTLKIILNFLRWQAYGFVAQNPSLLAIRLRSWLLKTACKIDGNVLIQNNRNFAASTDSALYFGTHILNHGGEFELGANSHLGAYCHVNVCKGKIKIGNDVAIGPHCRLIAYSNHFEAGKSVTEVRLQENITIGNNVFVGAGCTILPGTTIEDNVVVGANSLVKGVLKANSVYYGTPCRLARSGWFESTGA